MTRGDSVDGCLATLQTNKSPSIVCDANISVFCLVEEACQESDITGDGPLMVVRVCRMVNVGRRVAIRIEPLRYLVEGRKVSMKKTARESIWNIPYGKGIAIYCWS